MLVFVDKLVEQKTRGWGGVRRRTLSFVFVTVLILCLSPSSAVAADRLPDLAMARLRAFNIEETPDGRRLLRFTSIVVNVGSGPFELHGHRPDVNASEMTVTQRIYTDAGSFVDRPTTATMFFAGDGHNHWHVRDLSTNELERLDNGSKVGTGEKRGFCFADNYAYKLTLPNAPQSRVYRYGCGTSASLNVTVGISVGWGDRYGYQLPDQYIDITGLPSGRYRMRAFADEANWFSESNESNQETWADLQIEGTSVRVVRRAPDP
jgi:Lysyl oxidase